MFLWLIFWVRSHSHTVTIGLPLMIVLKWGDFHPRNWLCISTDSSGYPFMAPLIDPNWINSELMITLVNSFF